MRAYFDKVIGIRSVCGICSLILCFSLFACGGGGGESNSNNPQAPAISNLGLSPSTANQYDDDGQKSVSCSFDFTDDVGDVSTATVVIYDPQGVKIAEETVPLEGGEGITSGYVNITLLADTTSSGVFVFEFFVNDQKGLQSNRISGNFTVHKCAAFVAGVRYPSNIDFMFLGDTFIGDLNGDGRNDVAVIEGANSCYRILLYYQNSQGTFDAPQLLTTVFQLRGVAIADVNNDGLADLIVTGTSSAPLLTAEVAVFTQNPATHALHSPVSYILPATQAAKLAVADLNNDGLMDIVTFAPNTANGSLYILFQGSGGSLNLQTVVLSSPIASGSELHVADMNHDGLNDIVVQSGLLQLAVIKQSSAGVFNTTPDFYTVQTSYWSIFYSFALGDLNGDGRTDIAVADPGNGPKLNIFYQNGNGTLTGPTVLTHTINNHDEIDIADMNSDGLNDIVIFNSGNTVSILYQTDNHGFPYYKAYYLPTSSSGGTTVHQALSIGDVTGDGYADIVTSWSNEGIFVLRRLP